MQRYILRDLLILLGVFGLIWLSFSLLSYPEHPRLLSVEKEKKLGETYVDLIMKNPVFGKFENRRVDSVVLVITGRLENGLEHSDFSYHFIMFDSEMINAFTVPGGNILISTGLIGFCESPEELAAVMAHEMGHVEKRHVMVRLIKELGIEILTSGDPYVMGEITGMLTSAGFDRKQEEEADRFAAELLERASIEPRTLATLFRRLDQESDNKLLEQFEMLSTHPSFRSRIREALSYKPGEDFDPVSFDLDWEGIRAELN